MKFAARIYEEAYERAYQSRSRKARDYARVVAFMIIVLSLAALWHDDWAGPIIRAELKDALEWLEGVGEKMRDGSASV